MTSQREDHRSRADYTTFVEALEDAAQVLHDLELTIEGQLVVPANEIEFTTRRCRQLVRGVIREARRRGIS